MELKAAKEQSEAAVTEPARLRWSLEQKLETIERQQAAISFSLGADHRRVDDVPTLPLVV
jgi:hypothetical protein